MKVLIKDVKKILSEKITTEQRGILITAILCKDISEKITLAKFKVYVDINKFRRDMIYLHENNFISWSGYKHALKQEQKTKHNPDVHAAIDFMNNLYGRGFDKNKDSATTELRSRLKEYTLDDVKLVISNRYERWKNDKVMSEHLKPTTIFKRKLFDKYFEEANSTNIGAGIVSAEKNDLKEGDILDKKNTKNFIDKDIYTIKTYQTDIHGNKRGNGKTESHYGHVVKKLINLQENLKNNDQKPNKIHIFVKR